MSRRPDRPSADYNEVAPSILWDPETPYFEDVVAWKFGRGLTTPGRLRIALQHPKPEPCVQRLAAPRPPRAACGLTPSQRAVEEYKAAWRRIRRTKGGAA